MKKRKGFTLIELLVVIAVLGILAGGVLVAINPLKRINQANDTKIKNDIGQIANAMQAYYTFHQSYPNDPGGVYALVTSGDLKTEPKKSDGTSYSVVGSPSGCTTLANDCTNTTISVPLNAPQTPGDSWQWSSVTNQAGEVAPIPTPTPVPSATPTPTPDPLAVGLIGYWKMNESSGTQTVTDYSINGITGTSSSSTNVSTGKFGNARTLNGTNESISIPDTSLLRFGNALTFAVWVNINSGWSGWRELISRGGWGSGWDIVIDPGTMDFRSSCLQSTDHYISTGLLTGSGWHHFVVTFDSATHNIISYRDGSQITSVTTTSGTLCTSSGGNTIGLGQGAFWGLMDDLRIYNRALSSSEVSNLYNYIPSP